MSESMRMQKVDICIGRPHRSKGLLKLFKQTAPDNKFNLRVNFYDVVVADKWTPLMLVLLAANIGVAVWTRQSKKESAKV